MRWRPVGGLGGGEGIRFASAVESVFWRFEGLGNVVAIFAVNPILCLVVDPSHG